jgi:hypothetical protein
MPAKRKDEQVVRTCSRCGTQERCADGGLPAGWSMEVADKRVTYMCPTCARANLRAIEAKLPEEYWEW